MESPTCRNPDCSQFNVSKPYRPFPAPQVAGLEAPRVRVLEWKCGTCGQPCEVVIEPDTEISEE